PAENAPSAAEIPAARRSHYPHCAAKTAAQHKRHPAPSCKVPPAPHAHPYRHAQPVIWESHQTAQNKYVEIKISHFNKHDSSDAEKVCLSEKFTPQKPQTQSAKG